MWWLRSLVHHHGRKQGNMQEADMVQENDLWSLTFDLQVRGSSLYVTLREAWTNLPSQWQTLSNWAIPTPTKPHFLIMPLCLGVIFSQTTTFPYPLSNHLDRTITLYESPTSPLHQFSLFTFLVSVVIHGCVLMYEDLEMEASNENEYIFLLNSLDKFHSILFFFLMLSMDL